MPINPNDYYVIPSRAGERPDRWSLEIRRKGQPLGINMTADGFQPGLGRSVCRKEGVGGFSVRPSKGRQAATQVGAVRTSWNECSLCNLLSLPQRRALHGERVQKRSLFQLRTQSNPGVQVLRQEARTGSDHAQSPKRPHGPYVQVRVRGANLVRG